MVVFDVDEYTNMVLFVNKNTEQKFLMVPSSIVEEYNKRTESLDVPGFYMCVDSGFIQRTAKRYDQQKMVICEVNEYYGNTEEDVYNAVCVIDIDKYLDNISEVKGSNE